MGVKLAMEGAPGRVGPLPKKIKLVVFNPLYFRGATLGLWKGPFESEMGPLRPKISPRRPSKNPSKHVYSLFTLNIDDKRLQYFIVSIENGPADSERG